MRDYERIVYCFNPKLTMKMSPVGLLALAILSFVFPSAAQTGSVTFYSIDLSAKKQVKTALAPVGTVPFTGWLFDGDKRLAHATRGRLDMETGTHYCVRLSAEDVNPVVGPIIFVDSGIDQVPCQEASQDFPREN
jgi:hypothetical protein